MLGQLLNKLYEDGNTWLKISYLIYINFELIIIFIIQSFDLILVLS